MEDMPWFFEVREMEKSKTDWFLLYKNVKWSWGKTKGLNNRKRIWKDVNEIVNRIEKYRESGDISEEDY